MALKALAAAASVALLGATSAHAALDTQSGNTASSILGSLTTETDLALNDAYSARLLFLADKVGGGSGTATFSLTATEQVIAVETNTVNRNSGLSGAFVEFFVNGSSVGMIDGAALLSNQPTMINLAVGDLLEIVAGWSDVVERETQFTVRVDAVPLPAGAALFVTGAAAMAAMRKRKAKKA